MSHRSQGSDSADPESSTTAKRTEMSRDGGNIDGCLFTDLLRRGKTSCSVWMNLDQNLDQNQKLDQNLSFSRG
ncbi:hypothetical protein NQZ68_026808 [Dissostichus eleginoides]|nr:hypothetical protein NQZ68_026808 [Dissostichus eleginoides]